MKLTAIITTTGWSGPKHRELQEGEEERVKEPVRSCITLSAAMPINMGKSAATPINTGKKPLACETSKSQ